MLTLDAATTSKNLIAFIREVCRKESVKDILIATSGGIDSATSLTLAVKALGKEHVYPVLLPYGKLSKEGVEDAWLVINSLKIPHSQVTLVDIQPFVDSTAGYDPKMDTARKGNIMARMRMVILYDLAKKMNRLVVGTENKTEHVLGYYTRFGDEASDIEPIRHLYKTQVYLLAKYLGIPGKIVAKPPTAGLWEGQTDEGEFEFPYALADEVLYLHYEKKLSKANILKRGFDKDVIEKVWWWIAKGELKERLPHTPNQK